MVSLLQDPDTVRKVVAGREYDRIIFSGFDKSSGFIPSYLKFIVGDTKFKGKTESLKWSESELKNVVLSPENDDVFNNIVLGGTFDRIHSGEQI
jgi:hypothetical protein